MEKINLNFDEGGMKPIVEAFSKYKSYNNDFEIFIKHKKNSRIRVEKYPVLCSIVNEIRKNGNTCNVIFECKESCNQLNYAERMGFLSSLGVNYKYPLSKRNGGGRFIELKNISKIYYPGKEVIEVFEKNFNFNQDDAYDIATVISELANNGSMHSESKGGVMLYCQKYPTQKFLNLYIVDNGIGIYKAMNQIKKYKGLDELNTLKKSLEFGEGNGKGYGQGLFLVSQFIKINYGYLRLISGKYLYLVKEGIEQFHELDTCYSGVIIHIGIPFDINTSIQDIMDKQLKREQTA